MTIRDLENYLQHNQLIKGALSLENLRDCRVGIDGTMWIKEIIGKSVEEPFQLGMGGIPLTFIDKVIKDLEQWEANGITPLIVFSGLNINLDRTPFQRYSTQTRARKQAWDAYARKLEDAYSLFAEEKNVCMNFIRNLFPVLSEKKIQYITSPYLSWAQLAWFRQNNFVQHVFGNLELLLFGVPDLITKIDFTQKTFTSVDINQILQTVALKHEQFIDTCILAGFDFSITFPGISTQKKGTQFKAAVDLVRQHGTGFNVAQTVPNYVQTFQRTTCLIQHHIVFEPTCVCEPLNKESAPYDLHEIFGLKFPIGVYFFLSQGILNPQSINLIQHGLIEAPPLVDSVEYRTSLDKLIPLRSKTLAILAHSLNEEFHKPISNIRWYQQDVPIELDHSRYATLATTLQVYVKQPDIESEKTRSGNQSVNLKFVVDWLWYKTKNSITSAPSTRLINPDQIIAQILMHLFDVVEYSTHPLVLQALSGVSSQFIEPAIVVNELLRLDLLSGNPYTAPPSEGDGFHTLCEPNPNTFLIARVLSLIPVNCEAKPWQGPIDQDLAAFNSVVKAVYRSLRNLIDILLLNLFLQGKAQTLPNKFLPIANQLPFFQESNTAMGLLAKEFFRCESVAQLSNQFPGCTSIVEDLKKGFAFWDEVFAMVEIGSISGGIDSAVVNQFRNANSYLSEKRKLVDAK